MTQKGLDVWHSRSGDWLLLCHETMARAYLAMKAMEKPEPQMFQRKYGMVFDQRGKLTTRRKGLSCYGKPWEHRKDAGRDNGGRRRSDPQ